MGEVIQFIPRPNPDREKQLERQAIEIMSIALMGEPTMVGMEPVVFVAVPYGGQGIDGMFTDTARSEMNPDEPA